MHGGLEPHVPDAARVDTRSPSTLYSPPLALHGIGHDCKAYQSDEESSQARGTRSQ